VSDWELIEMPVSWLEKKEYKTGKAIILEEIMLFP
jgi:hypothetical protein